MGFWLVCSLHLFLLYSGLLLKIFYSGLFVQLPMLWKMEGLSIFMVVAKGRVVGVEEKNTYQCSIFGSFVKFSFFVYPPSCLFLLLFINKRGNPLVALYVQWWVASSSPAIACPHCFGDWIVQSPLQDLGDGANELWSQNCNCSYCTTNWLLTFKFVQLYPR